MDGWLWCGILLGGRETYNWEAGHDVMDGSEREPRRGS